MSDKMFSYSDADVRSLVLRCYPRLHAFAMRMFGLTAQEADDVLQDTLFRLLNSRPRVQESKVEAFLFRSIKNACINLRTRSRRTISLDTMETDAAWNLIAEVDMEGAEVAQRGQDDVLRLLEFAESFDPRTREIFQQSRIEGRTHEDIARELGISTRAVEKHLEKSVHRFRKEFRKPS